MIVRLFDTTLHGGVPAGGILDSVADRLALIRLLHGFGFHDVDAGNPGSSPSVLDLLRKAAGLGLRHARLVASGEVQQAAGTRFHALLDAPAIEAARVDDRWRTIGVSTNIIEASAVALADALELPLARSGRSEPRSTKGNERFI